MNFFNMTENMTDKEILQLKKDILEARIKYAYYTPPTKVERVDKKKKHITKT